ncbi:glycerophosphoryl diester phosphodiesterase membrane domain-containing protein [Streptomyces sp. NPDC046985]|uniref:glycerophosphoryl diester phosphodiesterase membrane domain-containing protein n=1 Tax=Streptomyces sp. NPDC046985 TaxID=3155377 RepID=UPI0033E2F1A0
MNDTPGWASPGSAPSDGQGSGASGPADAARPTRPEQPEQPADQQGSQPQDSRPQAPGAKWSEDQPPPGQWSAPAGAPDAPPSGQTPPPPSGPGWGPPPSGGPGAGHGGYSAPGGGYGGYGGPGGGYGAWGASWGGPPPAARPGVIPLRPLGVGEILDGAVSMMRACWRSALGISLGLAVLTQIAVVLMQRLALNGMADGSVIGNPNATPRDVFHALRGPLVGSWAALLLIALISTVAAPALLAMITSRAVLGTPVTLREAWGDARPRMLKLAGLFLLLLLIVLGVFTAAAVPAVLVTVSGHPGGGIGLAALGFLAATVVAVWLLVRFSLASPALMLERQGVKKALSRSAKLVRGAWWRIFGVQLLAAIVMAIVSGLIVIPFSIVADAVTGDGVSGLLNASGHPGWTYLAINGVGAVIGSMIKFPVTAGVTVLLYIDQRIRREALDLELVRAAGVRADDPSAPPAGS